MNQIPVGTLRIHPACHKMRTWQREVSLPQLLQSAYLYPIA